MKSPADYAHETAEFFLTLVKDGVPEVAAAEITAAWINAKAQSEQEEPEEWER